MRSLWATTTALMFIVLAISINAANDDSYESVKKDLASAAMVEMDVAVAVVSKVFGDVDSSSGQIYVAEDGRYFANLDSSMYLFDGRCSWDVSLKNRQATKKCLKEKEDFESRLSFLKNLDEYYSSSVIRKDQIYDLLLKDSSESSLPDSLRVYLDKTGDRLSRLEYYDLNNDLNRVYIISQSLLPKIDSNIFKISLSDSVEVISIP